MCLLWLKLWNACNQSYGQTKLMVEHVLFDLAKSDPEWSIACLRYFNPIVRLYASGTHWRESKWYSK